MTKITLTRAVKRNERKTSKAREYKKEKSKRSSLKSYRQQEYGKRQIDR